MTGRQGAPAPAPQPTARGATALTLGGTASVLNGVVHFLLPVYFPWADQLEGMYEPLEWALFATTVFLGLLLVLGGVLTIAVVRLRGVPTPVVLLTAGGMTAFWGLATIYELVFPFPAPVASWLLPTVSAAVTALHAAGLGRYLAARRAGSGPD